MNAFQVMIYYAEKLGDDAELSAWMLETFGKQLGIFVGYDGVDALGESDAPYLGMLPMGETIGPEAEAQEFTFRFEFGLIWDKEPLKTGSVLVDAAMSMMDREFSPRIMQAIHETTVNDGMAPDYGSGITYTSRAGYCERDLIVTLRIPTTIGLFTSTPFWRENDGSETDGQRL